MYVVRFSQAYKKYFIWILAIGVIGGLFLIGGTPVSFGATSDLVINEIMVSNNSFLRDPNFNNFSGWIELYNKGNSIINLNGYTLTDDLSDPAKWKIGGFKINPGEHFIFWTDDENKTNHTNFKLRHRGEDVGLFTPSGEMVDGFSYEVQVPNVSYGRTPDGGTNWAYFQESTPGGMNNGGGLAHKDQAGLPLFSHEAGFYDGGFNLSISPPSDNALVTFTLDGTEPTQSSTKVNGQIAINQTTVVRARAFEDGVLDSPVVTHTYLLNEGTTMPVLSLVTDPDYFFGDYNGIYVVGLNGKDGGCVDFKANYFQNWQRPLSVEFFEEDGTPGFNFDAEVEIQGGCSRNKPIKGLDIQLDHKYGTNELEYDLFPGYELSKFKAFLLRPSGQDQEQTLFRDGLIQSLSMEGMDLDNQAYRAVTVFINGEYWGIQNIREKLNDDYVETHHNEEDIDLIKRSFNKFEVKEGDSAAYESLEDYIRNNDLSDSSHYAYVAARVDINEFMDYQISQIYSSTRDWPHNNLRHWRPRDELGKWRWMTADLDNAFHNPTRDTVVWASDPNHEYDWSTLFFRKLLDNDGFRNEFIQRFAGHLNTSYAADRVLGFIDTFQQNIAQELPRHIQRWGSPLDWEAQVEKMRDFARRRSGFMVDDLSEYFNLSGMYNLTVNTGSGGSVLVSGVNAPMPTYSGAYFSGVPIRLRAKADPGYAFMEWPEMNNSSEEVYITLDKDFAVSAVFEASEQTMDLVINEIHYNPSDAQGIDDDYEFIELVNISGGTINLENYTFVDGIDYIFPEGSSVSNGEYILLAKNAESYGGLSCQVFQWSDGSLSNGGELLQLEDGDGQVLDMVEYSDSGDWPSEPDGDGPSLELASPDLDNSLAINWYPSAVDNGTPCEPNTDGPPAELVINEIHYNPSDSQGADEDYEFLELLNNGSKTVDLSNYSFFSGIDFSFPANTTIQPGEFILLANNAATYSGLDCTVLQWTDGSLSNDGELVQLSDAMAAAADMVDYDDEAPWPIAPDGNGPSLELIDPDLDNNLAESWQAAAVIGGTPCVENSSSSDHGLVINEIHYNPSDNQGADDDYEFLELFNNSPDPIVLDDYAFVAGVTFTFPQSTSIASGEYLLLASNAETYNSLSCPVFQWTDGSLSNGGELVQIDDPNGATADAVEYMDVPPWPLEADGGGPSLELIDPAFDNSLAQSWQASGTPGGSPCAANSGGVVMGDIVINEIHYNPSDEQGPDDDFEFLEIYNNGTQEVDFNGFKITAGIAYTFTESLVVPADGFVVLAKNENFYSDLSCPVVQWTEGSLDNGGEQVRLENGSGEVLDVVAYDDEPPWPILPDGQGPSLELKNPNLDNELPQNWQPSSDLGGTPCLVNSGSNAAQKQYFPLVMR